ncbi:MAG: hypothetical protein IKC01_07965 [Clostridia bacterium]|nr:hypothetical protein [Clostridia bacterium]
MNSVKVCIVACCVLLAGINRIMNIKKCSKALYEAIRFINLTKNNIRFSSMDYDGLVESGKKEGFSFISFDGNISISDCVGEKLKNEFESFVRKIGTTDETGQMSICDEYIEQFKNYYNEYKKNEKGKINVVGALSAFCVVCILILGG